MLLWYLFFVLKRKLIGVLRYLLYVTKRSYALCLPWAARWRHAFPPQELLTNSNRGRQCYMSGPTKTGSIHTLTTEMYKSLRTIITTLKVHRPWFCSGWVCSKESRHSGTIQKPYGTKTNVTVTITVGLIYVPLSVKANSRIATVKAEIHRLTQIPTNEQFITFGGKVLEDNKSLSHYCIHDCSFLKLSPIMRGGGKNAKAKDTIGKSMQSTIKKFFTANEVKTSAIPPPPEHECGKIKLHTRKIRTKETFHFPIPVEMEEETTSDDEPTLSTIPAWMAFGEKEWLGDEIIDCFLNCKTNKQLGTSYLSCSTYTILNLRTIDALLHEHFDGQITHPTSWKRAVMPIGLKNSRGETYHWCILLIENEYSSLTLFEPIEKMRHTRDKEMKQLCSDMGFYTNKPWKYTVAINQAQ